MGYEFTNINEAYRLYAEDPVRSNYSNLIYNLVRSADDGRVAVVPVYIVNTGEEDMGVSIDSVRADDGYYYMMLSNPDGMTGCPADQITVLLRISYLLKSVIEDDRVQGLCINPYSDVPCFIPAPDIIGMMNICAAN